MLNAHFLKRLSYCEERSQVRPITEISILPLYMDHISLIRNDRFLLNDITFKINKGGITVILGANGSGKTLLLKTCHGLLQPSTGQVIWNEKRNKFIKKKQAMVFQRTVLLKRSVASNVDYALKLQGKKKTRPEKVCGRKLMFGRIATPEK